VPGIYTQHPKFSLRFGYRLREQCRDSLRNLLNRPRRIGCTAWADNFKRGVPSAHILMIPNADHYVYLSNEAQVVTEMNAFLASLH